MPFTSILYANGPGYVHINGSRENITMVDYCKCRLMPFSFCTHLCCRAPWDAVVWLLPAFCSVKEKEKMVFMVFLSLPSDAFSARASLYTCKTLETSYLYFLWNTEKQSFSSSSSLLHITASVITCVYLRMEILLPTDQLLLKTHNFVFLTRLASLHVFKTSDCFSQGAFFESK